MGVSGVSDDLSPSMSQDLVLSHLESNEEAILIAILDGRRNDNLDATREKTRY